jgi:hypothetical protein
MELSISELNALMENAATRGATIALQRTGAAIKDEISQNEAFRLYTRARVESWVNAKQVQKIKGRTPTSPQLYSRSQLETVNTLTRNGKLK